MDDLSDYKIIISEDGSPLLSENNIVVKHITDDSIAYIENSDENREFLGITDCKEEFTTENLKVIVEGDDTTVDWHEDNINMLLSLYLQYSDEFKNRKRKKKDIWKKISNQIGISRDACDRKFRNLKQHYFHILRQRTRPGKGRFPPRWPYFDMMDQIFFDDPIIHRNIKTNFQTIQSKREPALLFGHTSPTVPRRKFIGQDEVKNRKRVSRVENVQELAKDMNKKQVEISSKLDELINKIQESNTIQKRRNELFEKYIQKIGTI